MVKNNVYVGQRYVPKIMGEWNNTISYEGLSIVTNEGNSYTSKKRVPIGIDLFNEEFWVSTGNYNAQLETYREEVKQNTNNLNEFTQVMTGELEKKVSKARLNTVFLNILDFGAKADFNSLDRTDNLVPIMNAVESLGEDGGTIYIPDGHYWISDRIHVQKSNVFFVAGKNAILEATNFLSAGDAVITFRGGVVGGKVPNTIIENCGVIGGTYISMTENTNGIAFVRCNGCYVYDVTVSSLNKGVSTQEYNHNVHFEKITVIEAPEGAITIETFSNNVFIKDITILRCGRAVHTTGNINNVFIDNIICYEATKDGLGISTSNDVTVSNVIIKKTAGRGFHSDNSKNLKVTNLHIDEAETYGIYLHTMTGSLKLDNVTLINVGKNGTTHAFYLNTIKIPYLVINSFILGNTHNKAVAILNSDGQTGQFRGNNFKKGTTDTDTYFAYGVDRPLIIDDIFGGVVYRIPTATTA